MPPFLRISGRCSLGFLPILGLTHLKGIALEVDNKSIPLICEELTRVRKLVDSKNLFVPHELGNKATQVCPSETGITLESVSPLTRQRLTRAYEVYVEGVSGHSSDPERIALEIGAMKWSSDSGRELYASQYLPHEILCWGGNVREMFPESCGLLDDHGIALHQFLTFWFSQERRSGPSFDFFLLKIELFEKFFGERLPEERSVVQREAEGLREGYSLACGSQ